MGNRILDPILDVVAIPFAAILDKIDERRKRNHSPVAAVPSPDPQPSVPPPDPRPAFVLWYLIATAISLFAAAFFCMIIQYKDVANIISLFTMFLTIITLIASINAPNKINFSDLKKRRKFGATVMGIFSSILILLLIIGSQIIQDNNIKKVDQANADAKRHAIATAQAHAVSTAQATSTAIAQATATENAVTSHFPFGKRKVVRDLWEDNSGTRWLNKPPTCYYQGSLYFARVVNASPSICTQDEIPSFNDFTYQIQINSLQGGCGGIAWSNEVNTSFVFMICKNGSYIYGIVSNGGLPNPTINRDSHVHVGTKQINTIAVVALSKPCSFQFYVNDSSNPVLLIKSGCDYQQARIGVVVNNDSSKEPTTATFKHAEVVLYGSTN